MSTTAPSTAGSSPAVPSPAATASPAPAPAAADGIPAAAVAADAHGSHTAPARLPPARWLSRLPRPSAGTLLAATVLVLALGWALAPSAFAPGNPLLGQPSERLQAPGLAHWFGTDHLGRDVYTRTVHGAAVSLGTTALAVLAAFGIGSAAGAAAATAGGVAESLIMRTVDVAQSIPGLLLSMAVVTALGFGPVAIALAVAASSAPAFARIAHGEVLRWRSSLFVEAARLNGVGAVRTVVRHVLPHAAGPVLALAAVEVGTAILAVSALSFLGYGAPPPQPEWGLLVSEGRDYPASAWWLTALPGLVIAAVALSVNHLARRIGVQRRPA